MANTISGWLKGTFAQAQSVTETATQTLEDHLPESLKAPVSSAASAVDEFVSSAPMLAQLTGATSLPHLSTPAQVKAEYVKDATRDLTDPATLRQLNEELKKRDPNAKPLTAAEARQIINGADVKSLTPQQYATLKEATGGSRDNPATTLDAANRAKLAESGAENLARYRLRAQGSSAEPTPEQVAQAKADLRAIDPGIFAQPPKDVVYVNQKHIDHNGDPRQTKVAAHEFTHLLLDHRGVPEKDPDGTDPQHAIIGRLGWNQTYGTSGQVIPGETSNWATPPGSGLPPRQP